MGRTYTFNATITMTDPMTGNSITSNTATKNGMLPYFNITFDANGGTGAPANMSGFADVDNGYRTTTPIPANAIPTKGAHDMFAGWATSVTATQPDTAYNPSNYAPTIWQYDRSNRAQTTTLYAVWHEAKAPVISEVHRDPTSHHVIATGTAQPWNAIGPPTVSGTSRTGLRVDMVTVTSDGTLSVAGIASGIETQPARTWSPCAYEPAPPTQPAPTARRPRQTPAGTTLTTTFPRAAPRSSGCRPPLSKFPDSPPGSAVSILNGRPASISPANRTSGFTRKRNTGPSKGRLRSPRPSKAATIRSRPASRRRGQPAQRHLPQGVPRRCPSTSDQPGVYRRSMAAPQGIAHRAYRRCHRSPRCVRDFP